MTLLKILEDQFMKAKKEHGEAANAHKLAINDMNISVRQLESLMEKEAIACAVMLKLQQILLLYGEEEESKNV